MVIGYSTTSWDFHTDWLIGDEWHFVNPKNSSDVFFGIVPYTSSGGNPFPTPTQVSIASTKLLSTVDLGGVASMYGYKV